MPASSIRVLVVEDYAAFRRVLVSTMQSRAEIQVICVLNPPKSNRETAQQTKDDLNDTLFDLDRSTNRLRRKFNPLDTWIETKAQMQQVMDHGRRINQVMVRGKYGSQAEKYWAALRNNIKRSCSLLRNRADGSVVALSSVNRGIGLAHFSSSNTKISR